MPECYITKSVVAVESVNGQIIAGNDYTSGFLTTELTLEWPEENTARVIDFYERLLKARETRSYDWNCHSFVSTVIGWEVEWSTLGEPLLMPVKFSAVDSNSLEDLHPYAITRGGKLLHSMIGLPIPDHTLGPWGFGMDLFVSSNEDITRRFPGAIREHKTPSPFASKVKNFCALSILVVCHQYIGSNLLYIAALN